MRPTPFPRDAAQLTVPIALPTIPIPIAEDAPNLVGTSSKVGSTMGSTVKRVAIASAIAQVVSQVVTLLQTVVLARLLTPTEIGIFAAGTVLTTFAANFSEGGMRSGLIQRSDGLADAAETVFRGTLVTGTLLSVASLIAAPLLGFAFDDPAVAAVAAVCSGTLLLFAMTNVPEAMLQREFSVKRRLVVGPAVGISFAVASVVCAVLGMGVWSMVVGQYVSQATWVIAVWALTDWRPGRGRATWQEWRRLSRYGAPLVVGLIGSRGQQLVESVVVGRGLSTAALGFYRYGTRISRVPVDVTLEVVANALFPAFSRMADEPERMRSAYLTALGAVSFFAAAVSGLTIALGESGVVILLGEEWRGAGVAVAAMAGLGLGKAFRAIAEEAIKAVGRTRLLNRLTGTEVGLGIGLLVLIIPFGLFGVGLAISITALTVGVLGLLLTRSMVGVTFGGQLRVIVPSLVATAVATVGTWFLERDVLHAGTQGTAAGIGLLLLDVAAFGVAYLAVMAVLAPALVRRVLNQVGGRFRRRSRG
jgi:PST family polysaccharide transporter